MHKSKIKELLPEPKPNKELKADGLPSAKLLPNPMLCVCAFWKWLKELRFSVCPKCNKKGVSFSHEEHFTLGSPNVYHCKFCNEYFI